MAYGLILNPGSTSTKIGVFDGELPVFTKTIQHSQEEIQGFQSVIAQKDFRAQVIMQAIEENGVSLESIDAVIGIGGLLTPGDAGVYEVNETMVADLSAGKYGEHAANLGGLVGKEIAQKLGIKAYIADPITTDEMHAVARISGMPEIGRIGRSHTLNQKRVASIAAQDLGLDYEKARMIVVHFGGGISVVAHLYGRMVDTSNARGEGPFCIDRTGGVNAFELTKMCYSGKYTKEQMLKKISGEGGVVAYLQTRDFREVLARRAAGEQLASDVFDSMAYQVAKEIGAQSAVLSGQVDAIVFTGGMANSKELTDEIAKRVSFIAPIKIYPGEKELEALASYLCKIAENRVTVKNYIGG